MMLDIKEWISASRFKGVMRYHSRCMSLKVLWILGILLITQLVSLLMLSANGYAELDVSASFALTMITTLLCAILATNEGARFLTRFGTSRTAVWLGGLLSLMIWMFVLLLGTLIVGAAVNGVIVLTGRAQTDIIRDAYGKALELTSMQAYWHMLGSALGKLPQQTLYLLEWSSVFWLLAACLRRKKGVTITVLIALPLLFSLTMLVPALREAVSAVEGGNQSQVMQLMMRWGQWISKAALWLEQKWPVIQLLLALGALPLSWLCVRDTPQP